MTILYMQGFELGTTLSEAQTLSGETWTNTLMNNNSTLGSSSSGSGRSMSLNIVSSIATGSGSQTNVSRGMMTPITFPTNVQVVNWGFRAAITGSLPANPSGAHCGVAAASGYTYATTPYLMGFSRGATAQTGAPYTLNAFAQNAYSGVVVNVSFTVPDNNMHYYSILTYVSGGNRFVQFYMDKTLIGSGSLATFSYPTNMMLYWAANNGTVAAGDRCNIFSEVDDVYMNHTEGALGDVQILRTPAATDASVQYTNFGGAGSNHAAVDKINLTNTTGIQSDVSGATDYYGITDPALPRRRIYATRTTVYGTGDGSVTTQPLAKVGSTTVTGPATALGVFGTAVTTGWDSTLANTNIANLQFGVKRS